MVLGIWDEGHAEKSRILLDTGLLGNLYLKRWQIFVIVFVQSATYNDIGLLNTKEAYFQSLVRGSKQNVIYKLVAITEKLTNFQDPQLSKDLKGVRKS